MAIDDHLYETLIVSMKALPGDPGSISVRNRPTPTHHALAKRTNQNFSLTNATMPPNRSSSGHSRGGLNARPFPSPMGARRSSTRRADVRTTT